MGAIDRYKFIIQELYFIFSKIGEKSNDISLPLLKKEEVKVMHYANRIADEIKGELIGGGVEFEIRGRLKIAYWALGRDQNVASYFPLFESPENNNVMFDALNAIYGDEADEAKKVVQSISKWANFMVEEVSKMLEEVCKFVGYTPEPLQNIQELATPEAKELINKAIATNLIENTPEGLKWKGTKVLCAYFADRASHSLNLSNKMDKEGNITTSWKPFEALFGIEGLKDAKQNWMRLNTKFEPTGYEKVDALM